MTAARGITPFSKKGDTGMSAFNAGLSGFGDSFGQFGSALAPATLAPAAHGHSHGGEPCTGDHHDEHHENHDSHHGHSHGGHDECQDDHHGHSHGGGHGHSHGGHEEEHIELRRNTPLAALRDAELDHDRRTKTCMMSFMFYLRVLWGEERSRAVLFFVFGEVAFICCELGTGAYTDSIALIADSIFHMFYGFALTLSLAAIALAKQKPTFSRSYGSDRMEVLLGFTGATLLLFFSLFLVIEVIERLLVPPDVTTSYIFPVSVASVALNIVRTLFFRDAARLRAEQSQPSASAGDAVMRTKRAFWELAPCLSTLMSSFLVIAGLPFADTAMAIVILFLLLYFVTPITAETGKVLLQTTPTTIRGALDKCLKEASTLDGVLECKMDKCHFWTQAPGVFAGNIVIRVRGDAKEQVVLSHVTNMFSPFLTHLTIQVEKDDWVPNPF